jgi:hypothetical protein
MANAKGMWCGDRKVRPQAECDGSEVATSKASSKISMMLMFYISTVEQSPSWTITSMNRANPLLSTEKMMETNTNRR